MPLLRCLKSELNLDVVLLNGQSFRWRKESAADRKSSSSRRQYFVGIAKHRFWRLWREDDANIGYDVLARFKKCNDDDEIALRNYFQLDISLASLYAQWKENDENFAKTLEISGPLLEGIRILAQNPTETLFSFICSSNNNIKRISKMIERLCELYGESITISSFPCQEIVYDFADISRMAADDAMESKLRESGFGYRAAYLHRAAKNLHEIGGELWLNELANETYDIAKQKLQQLPGIGPKVADCICLMSLGKSAVVPVDTHVFQITAARYMPNLNRNKSLTKAVHNGIGEIWRQKFGAYAGWAHTVLFTAQLRQFDAKSRIVRPQKAKIVRRKEMAETERQEPIKSHISRTCVRKKEQRDFKKEDRKAVK
uniref:N-glycosylase/DNA lyase n=1 Tax=Parascaris univalens TaxID=6257 RepID=A0A915CGV8_PARUN